MKAETFDYFAKAERLLANASKLLSVGLPEDAGRNCYLAGMHAARGLLFEDGFIITKKHKTLYGALAKALHARGIHDTTLTSFLPTMMNLKLIADYETGDSAITPERAAEAIKTAAYFLGAVSKIAETPITPP